jgi:hypothetical protein
MVHTYKAFTPYELVFGRKPNIPSSLSRAPEPQYNYDHYVYDLKRMMQESYKIARDNLIRKKENNKKYNDRTAYPIDLRIGDRVLIK